MRILIIVASVVFGLMLLAAAAGALLWWYMGADAMAAVEQGTHDGMRLGQSADDTACRDQAITLMADCDGFVCGLYDQSFISACLTSAPAGELCAEIPQDLSFSSGVMWVSKRCQEMGQDDSECGGIMQSVLDHCAR